MKRLVGALALGAFLTLLPFAKVSSETIRPKFEIDNYGDVSVTYDFHRGEINITYMNLQLGNKVGMYVPVNENSLEAITHFNSMTITDPTGVTFVLDDYLGNDGKVDAVEIVDEMGHYVFFSFDPQARPLIKEGQKMFDNYVKDIPFMNNTKL